MLDLELVFGPLALELNPSAVTSAASAVASDPDEYRLSVSYRSDALNAAARSRLRDLPDSLVRAGPGAGRETLHTSPAALADVAGSCRAAAVLREAGKCLERGPNPPEIMGVINVTPDSFSDGGRYLDPQRAVEHGLELESQGATILDVGGESTRPGARPVAVEEETRRVVPVVRGLAARSRARISIDTTKAPVARAALDAGANVVNDVSAGEADPGMLPLVAESGCEYVLMHARGAPQEMQVDPRYTDAPTEVLDYLRRRVAHCLRSGIDPTRMIVDPGIGFGKRLEHNTSLLRRLPELRSLGRPLLVGVSRKSFIGHITGEEDPLQWRERSAATERPDQHAGFKASPGGRVGGTAAAVTVSVLGGAEILRVHDVAVMAEVIRVAEALRPGRSTFPAPRAPRPEGD